MHSRAEAESLGWNVIKLELFMTGGPKNEDAAKAQSSFCYSLLLTCKSSADRGMSVYKKNKTRIGVIHL